MTALFGKLFKKSRRAPSGSEFSERRRAQRNGRMSAIECPSPQMDGVFRQAVEVGRTRLIITGAVMSVAFFAIGVRLVDFAALERPREPRTISAVSAAEATKERAEITDRNGVVLATSLTTVGLSADPKRILDPVETAEKLSLVLPDLDRSTIFSRITKDAGFVWLHRQLTPRQQAAVNRLGLPGLNFHYDETRAYPQGHLFSHIIGFTDIDNNGLSGVEKWFDSTLRRSKEPLALSLDSRMQHAVRRELSSAIDTYSALGGSAIVLDANSAEVMAMVSLPDFDPNRPAVSPENNLFNRATLGVYELGSTFKIFNTAMALDSGIASIADSYDAREPIKISRFRIRDYHAKNRVLTIPEIFIYSSNIGSAKMAIEVGPAGQKEFMKKLGLLDPLAIELPESGSPQYPDKWSPISTMTISYGHGISVTPLHLTAGVAAMVNGGIRREPSLVKRTEPVKGRRILGPDVSDTMRRLMRLNTLEGSGGRADIPGYLVGGKTGTAEKPGTRGYQRKALISSFVGAFPMNDPRYIVYVVLDEPKGTKETHGYATGGWVAAPSVGAIIEAIAPMAAISPQEENAPSVRQALAFEMPEVDPKKNRRVAAAFGAD